VQNAPASIFGPAGLSCSGQKVVWEFILPGQDASGKPICTIRDTVPTNIHRAHAYNSKTHKGFVGKI